MKRNVTKPGNVVNGWWIIDREVEIRAGRKRNYITAVCPSCDEVVEMRADHVHDISQCVTCHFAERAA